MGRNDAGLSAFFHGEDSKRQVNRNGHIFKFRMYRPGDHQFFIDKFGPAEPESKMGRIQVTGGKPSSGGKKSFRINLFHLFGKIVELILLEKRTIGKAFLAFEVKPKAITHRNGFALLHLGHSCHNSGGIPAHFCSNVLGLLVKYNGWSIDLEVIIFDFSLPVKQHFPGIHF